MSLRVSSALIKFIAPLFSSRDYPSPFNRRRKQKEEEQPKKEQNDTPHQDSKQNQLKNKSPLKLIINKTLEIPGLRPPSNPANDVNDTGEPKWMKLISLFQLLPSNVCSQLVVEQYQKAGTGKEGVKGNKGVLLDQNAG